MPGVVVALIDPTSRGEGGVAVLRKAGVDVEVGTLESEARLVLGSWLMSQRLRRPVITWCFHHGGSAGRPDQNAVDDLRRACDLIVEMDTIEEGLPGGHGKFAVPDADVLGEDIDVSVKRMFEAGARTVLAIGVSHWLQLARAANLVDRCVIEVDREFTHTGTTSDWARA